MEKKRRQEAHEKIIFGAIIIGFLKDMRSKGLIKDVSNILKAINCYTKAYHKNNILLIEKIANVIN